MPETRYWYGLQPNLPVKSPTRFPEDPEKLFPFLLVLDAVWAASPLLLAAKGLGLALAGMAGLAYLPFSQRTLMRAAYRRQWWNWTSPGLVDTWFKLRCAAEHSHSRIPVG